MLAIITHFPPKCGLFISDISSLSIILLQFDCAPLYQFVLFFGTGRTTPTVTKENNTTMLLRMMNQI